MPNVLQLHLAMMSKYSKFGVDALVLFEYWATLKFLHGNNDDLAITIARHLLRKRRAKKQKHNNLFDTFYFKFKTIETLHITIDEGQNIIISSYLI